MAVAPRRLILLSAWHLCLGLGACTSIHAPPAPTARTEVSPGATPDASYDWHGLIVAPFGMLLKESPFTLHEVLLFHDEAQAGDAENKDCHAIEGQPPRFVGRVPDEYLLCFSHDRLTRIEAAAELPVDESAAMFARACAVWLKVPPTAPTAPAAPAAPATRAAPTLPAHCEGRDGAVSFSARLGSEAGDAPNRLSISLVDSASLTDSADAAR